LRPLPDDFRLRARNEFLVDLNETSQIRHAGLGENQLVATVDHPLGRWLRIEAGYMLQHLDGKGGDLYNHTFVFGFAATPPTLRELF
jgi:hypothetical protein